LAVKRQATEQLSLEDALARLPSSVAYARKILSRLNSIRLFSPDSTLILDIGAAQGRFVIGCAGLGYRAIGIEPWAAARDAADELIRLTGVDAEVLPGTAEATEMPDEEFDVVTCAAVIEHVNDAQAAFAEAYRILKPGGIFWFCAASSRCPRQHEIDGFPLFGWYPHALKRRVMEWARVNRPHLIGHTDHPAINWFTPSKARRMLHRAGFRNRVFDRWDLRQPSEGGPRYRAALRLVQLGAPFKLLADMALPGCAFATVK
jgi:ubiquinone/menaquinone biosynthesis C-methylase UbiE